MFNKDKKKITNNKYSIYSIYNISLSFCVFKIALLDFRNLNKNNNN